jgi:hypothetical protein
MGSWIAWLHVITMVHGHLCVCDDERDEQTFSKHLKGYESF